MMTLVERLRADRADRAVEHYVAQIESITLADKFRVVNMTIWAEPLGLCGLQPEVEYQIRNLKKWVGGYSYILKMILQGHINFQNAMQTWFHSKILNV